MGHNRRQCTKLGKSSTIAIYSSVDRHLSLRPSQNYSFFLCELSDEKSFIMDLVSFALPDTRLTVVHRNSDCSSGLSTTITIMHNSNVLHHSVMSASIAFKMKRNGKDVTVTKKRTVASAGDANPFFKKSK